MKVHISLVNESELPDLLSARAAFSALHLLTDDPREADLILLLGNFSDEPRLMLEHPLYVSFPDKCAVYTEDDNYVPLAPGVYCSAHTDEHTRAGRVSSYAYVSANGVYANPFVADARAADQRPLLFSFLGASSAIVRKRLFNIDFGRPDVLVANTSAYSNWDLSQPGREDSQQRYARNIAESHFHLCPRGAGAGSIRLFEVMRAGVAPVLIADDYLLPPNVAWDDFLLRVPEAEIGRLPEILETHRATSAERGRLARTAWLEHFAPEKEFDAIVDACAAALRHGPPSEAVFRHRQKALIARARLVRGARAMARGAVLRSLKLLRIENPYQMR